MSAESPKEKLLRMQLDELWKRFDAVTKRIAALDTDIDRALDTRTKQVRKEERAELEAEREQVVDAISRVELQLSSSGFLDPGPVPSSPQMPLDGDPPAEVNWHRKTTSMDVSSKDLPCQDTETLFGRKQELKRIGKFLSVVGGASFLNVWGMPGIGKTALVGKAVCDYVAESDNLHPERPFGPKVWLGHKELHKLEDLVDFICVKKLDREDISREKPESKPTLLLQALKQIAPQRSLIIINGLDEISDGQVVEFLGQLGQEAKVIAITSRRMDGLAFKYEREEIKELLEEEALQLIRSRFESREVPFTEAIVRELYDRIGGVPYALRLIIGEFSRDFPPDSKTIADKLRGLTRQDGDIAAKCFNSNFSSIQDKPTLRVLQALALFPKDASREALKSVAGIDDDPRPFGDIVQTLEHRALVHQSVNRVWMLPLTRQYTEQLMSFQRVRKGLWHRFVDYFVAFARDHGTQDCWLGSIDWKGTDYIEGEWSNVWQAVQWADKELGRWADVIFFEYYLFHGLAFHDRWDKRLDLGSRAIKAMKALEGSPMARGDKWLEREARIYIDTLGWVYCHRGQYKTMRENVEKGLGLIELMHRPNRDLQAIARCYLSRADHNENGISVAQQNLIKVREYENGMHASVVARLRSYTGELQSAAGDWSAARASFEEGLLIRQAIGEQIGMATNRLQLANVEFRLGHYEEAKALFKESMSDEKIRGVNLAFARFGLAQIDWVEEEYKQALALVGDAINEFGRLGMGSDLKQAMELVYKAVTEFERLGMEPELKQAMELVDRAVTEFKRLGMEPELKRAKEIQKQWIEQEKVRT